MPGQTFFALTTHVPNRSVDRAWRHEAEKPPERVAFLLAGAGRGCSVGKDVAFRGGDEAQVSVAFAGAIVLAFLPALGS